MSGIPLQHCRFHTNRSRQVRSDFHRIGSRLTFYTNSIPRNLSAGQGIQAIMRPSLCRFRAVPALLFLSFLVVRTACAQSAPQSFHWIDFRSAKDEPTVRWVTDSLASQPYSAIREIGVQWDSALVVTTLRATPQSSPADDRFTLWSVSLSHRQILPILTGLRLHYLNWLTLGSQILPELGLTWQSCLQCDASIYFTAVYYNSADHAWRARWIRSTIQSNSSQSSVGAALRTAAPTSGVTVQEVYGLRTDLRGNSTLDTWLHLDFGAAKPAQDYVYEYSVDPTTGLDFTQALGDEHATPMRQQLCQLTPAQSSLLDGQNSTLCHPDDQAATHSRLHPRHLRLPVTTPPANNQGRSNVARPQATHSTSAHPQ